MKFFSLTNLFIISFILIIVTFFSHFVLFSIKKMDRQSVCISGGHLVSNGFDFSKVKMEGDNGYIPLDLKGGISERSELILRVIREFEKQKHLKVVDWKIYSQSGLGFWVTGRIEGIGVTCKDKDKE